jgi:hypothetical protein
LEFINSLHKTGLKRAKGKISIESIKDRQYIGQKEKDRQYTGQKEKDRQYIMNSNSPTTS